MKKKFIFCGIIFLISALVILAFLYIGKDETRVFIDGNEISVTTSKNNENETYVLADEIFQAAGVDYEKNNGIVAAKGKKELEINTVTNTIMVGGEVFPSDFVIENNNVMIPAYLAGEVIGNGVLDTENEVYFFDTTPVKVMFRENGREIDFDYSDSMFLLNSNQYNHALAKISIGAAVSAFSSKESDKNWGDEGDFGRDKNIVKFYKDIGFNNIKSFNYDKSLNDKSNKSAFIIAQKTVKTKDENFHLVAVSIRGGAYGNEWVSNFDLGDGKIHKGFLLCAEEITKELYKYIGENTMPVKLWITGFSRGGGIANIAAAKIGDEGLINPENIYAYTFAAPQGTTIKSAGSEKYGYIFNIISENDLVPLLAPSKWGFGRYGTDVKLPSLLDYDEDTAFSESERISKIYSKISSAGEFNLFNIEKSNQRKQILATVESLCTAMGAKGNYTTTYSDIIMDFVECNNTKIKTSGGKWKWASPDEGLVNKYGEGALSLLSKAKENEFLKNIESILGETGKQLLCFGAICLKHNKNPYKVIVEEIGIGNLATIASVFSPSGSDAATIAKAHYPESYMAQMLGTFNPSLMTSK